MKQNNYNNTDMCLIDAKEVCRRLGIGHWKLYDLIRTNAIKSVMIGRSRKFIEKSINDFMISREQ